MSDNVLKKPSRFYLNRSGFFALSLLGLIFVLLVLIINVQHTIRHLETGYASQLKDVKQLQEEWGRLSLEKNHLAALARVEHIARDSLAMVLPSELEKEMRHTLYVQTIKTGLINESIQPK